jgi:hypothetical protein
MQAAFGVGEEIVFQSEGEAGVVDGVVHGVSEKGVLEIETAAGVSLFSSGHIVRLGVFHSDYR